uniref:Proline-rich acidic protein 1 n=1 Tax=Jaculus jaculus TaxID=51337 RepID=A0A8C5KEB6_JACJA
MRRFLLTIFLVAGLLQEAGTVPVPQVSVKIKGKHGIPDHDIDKAWGTQDLEPPEKDDQLRALLLMHKQKLSAAEEKHPDVKTLVKTEDILRHFRSPLLSSELDLDSLYHPVYEEAQGEEEPQMWEMLSHQVLLGPEEDLDHISHPMEDSR